MTTYSINKLLISINIKLNNILGQDGEEAGMSVFHTTKLIIIFNQFYLFRYPLPAKSPFIFKKKHDD